MEDTNKITWLLLIHQIPPKPDYFRVKIWRRLQKVGAVAVKQSVYVLPDTEQAYEDLLWIVKEIDEGGGTASLSRTVFLQGISDAQVKALFHDARDEDYEKIVGDAQVFIKNLTQVSKKSSRALVLKTKKELSRLQHRFDEVVAIDFFHASGRDAAESILLECNTLLKETNDTPVSTSRTVAHVHGQTWVTRKGLYVDRIGCAWLIERFIDREAEFKFVADEKYSPQIGEVSFDMFDAEFTHQGDKCTFEVLVETFNLATTPVTAIAEIVHDIDLKDDKYGRPEMVGIQALFSGMAMTCSNDQERLQRGVTILDELYACFLRHHEL